MEIFQFHSSPNFKFIIQPVTDDIDVVTLLIRERFEAIGPDIADNLRRLDERLAKQYGLTAAKHIQDIREKIARGGYYGLMKLIKTGVLPASIIGFVGVGLTQSQREKIVLVAQDSKAAS